MAIPDGRQTHIPSSSWADSASTLTSGAGAPPPGVRPSRPSGVQGCASRRQGGTAPTRGRSAGSDLRGAWGRLGRRGRGHLREGIRPRWWREPQCSPQCVSYHLRGGDGTNTWVRYHLHDTSPRQGFWAQCIRLYPRRCGSMYPRDRGATLAWPAAWQSVLHGQGAPHRTPALAWPATASMICVSSLLLATRLVSAPSSSLHVGCRIAHSDSSSIPHARYATMLVCYVLCTRRCVGYAWRTDPRMCLVNPYIAHVTCLGLSRPRCARPPAQPQPHPHLHAPHGRTSRTC